MKNLHLFIPQFFGFDETLNRRKARSGLLTPPPQKKKLDAGQMVLGQCHPYLTCKMQGFLSVCVRASVCVCVCVCNGGGGGVGLMVQVNLKMYNAMSTCKTLDVTCK